MRFHKAKRLKELENFIRPNGKYSANHDSHVVQCPYRGRNLTNLSKSNKYLFKKIFDRFLIDLKDFCAKRTSFIFDTPPFKILTLFFGRSLAYSYLCHVFRWKHTKLMLNSLTN